MSTGRIYQWYGDETDPSTNPFVAVANEASGASAPTNGSIARRRIRTMDPTTDQTVQLWFPLDASYASGGTLNFQYSSNATTGNVIFKTAWGLIVPGTTDFDVFAYGTVTPSAASTVPGTAGVYKAVAIDLAVTGATVGSILGVMFGRDADNAGDTCASTAELVEPWYLSFTTL